MGGGLNDDDSFLYRVDVYHPDTNIWNTIDTPHAVFAITVLMGKIVVVGGFTRSDEATTNKVLILESGQWKDYTQIPTARVGSTAISHQSRMIVMGGNRYGNDTISTTEIFDGTTGQWFKCDDLPQVLMALQSVIVGDTLYVLGGAYADDSLSTAVYAAPLDTLSSHQLKWQQLVDTPCGGSAAVGLSNKYVLAVGGKKKITKHNDQDDDDDTELVASNEVFTLNSTSTTWTLTTTIPVGVFNTAVLCDNNSRLVVIGGFIGDNKFTNKMWIGSFQ